MTYGQFWLIILRAWGWIIFVYTIGWVLMVDRNIAMHITTKMHEALVDLQAAGDHAKRNGWTD